MFDPNQRKLSTILLLQRALSRWENEGGAIAPEPGRPVKETRKNVKDDICPPAPKKPMPPPA
jgi:hypothetical protein